jgi:SAM-dependent methyltransferase
MTARSRRIPVNKTEAPFDLMGAEWLKLTEKQKTSYVEKAFKYWRRGGFPHYKLSDEQMMRELRALDRVDSEQVIQDNEIYGSNAGVTLASYFHRQMWSVRVSRYLSPMDCFRDDQRLRAVIRRSLSVWPERHGANASCLRKMLKTYSNCAAVSNFKPSVARAIIHKFSSPGDTVIDFSAGFGGRLLGCLTLPRRYIGIEPSKMQVRGLKRCIDTVCRLGASAGVAEIRCGCAEDLMPTVDSESSALVFSSPPYHDWEKYSFQKTQSFVRYPSYSEWLDKFLRPVVEQSYRVLRNGGYLAVNVPNGSQRLSLAEDLEDLAKAAGFTLFRVYRLRLSKVAFLHPRTRTPKWELISIFRKPDRSRSGRG